MILQMTGQNHSKAASELGNHSEKHWLVLENLCPEAHVRKKLMFENYERKLFLRWKIFWNSIKLMNIDYQLLLKRKFFKFKTVTKSAEKFLDKET